MLDAGVRAASPRLLAMAGRFEEAREHIAGEQPRPRPGRPDGFLGAARWTIAEAMEYAGDLAGAERAAARRVPEHSDARGAGPRGASAADGRSSSRSSTAIRAAGTRPRACLAYGEEIDGAEPSRASSTPDPASPRGRRLAAQRGQLAEAPSSPAQASRSPIGADVLNFRARVWLALADVRRAEGQTADADAAVAPAIELYEQKGNIAAAARLRAAENPLPG